ncbi:MAG: tyrosine-type recombinase/integrase [Synergistaceae bacterium]|nr:tyrosine-type recombinase/integrase [Synergistaceae bacterium]
MSRPQEKDKKFLLILSRFEDYMLLERASSQNTLKAYSSDLKAWYCYCKKNEIPPLNLTGDSISRFLTEQSITGKSRNTVQRNAAVLSSFSRFLAYDGYSEIQPLLDPLPKRSVAIPQIMTEGEIQRIINVCEDGTLLGARDRAVIELAYGVGLRASELCNIKLRDIDDHNGLIYTRGKGDKERAVPYVGGVRKVTERYIKEVRPSLNKLELEWLFLSRTGKQMRREFLWHILQKRGKAANISSSRLYPHILRHTFATHLLRNGMNQRTLQEILGHTSILTTEKYTHLDTEIHDFYDKYHPRS